MLHVVAVSRVGDAFHGSQGWTSGEDDDDPAPGPAASAERQRRDPGLALAPWPRSSHDACEIRVRPDGAVSLRLPTSTPLKHPTRPCPPYQRLCCRHLVPMPIRNPFRRAGAPEALDDAQRSASERGSPGQPGTKPLQIKDPTEYKLSGKQCIPAAPPALRCGSGRHVFRCLLFIRDQ